MSEVNVMMPGILEKTIGRIPVLNRVARTVWRRFQMWWTLPTASEAGRAAIHEQIGIVHAQLFEQILVVRDEFIRLNARLDARSIQVDDHLYVIQGQVEALGDQIKSLATAAQLVTEMERMDVRLVELHEHHATCYETLMDRAA